MVSIEPNFGCIDAEEKSFHNARPLRKLYEKTGLPDNYVDHQTFLARLKRNLNVHVHSFEEMFLASFPIVQQLATILAFVAVFILILEEKIGSFELMVLANCSTIVSYAGWVIYVRHEISHQTNHQSGQKQVLRQKGRETILYGLIFTLLLMFLCPVLKTLTEDTSSDTIWASASLLLLLSWVTHDYSREMSSSLLSFQYPISLNSMMMASIALASRLPNTTQVFGFLSLAVNTFAFFPLFRRIIFKLTALTGDFALTILLISLTISLWVFIYLPIAIIFGLAVLFISFICPLWLLHLQKYKNTIHGPWDEAVLGNKST